MDQGFGRRAKTLLLFLCWATVSLSLNYEELERLGVSCPPRDSCRNRTGADAVNYNTCECDVSCIQKGTCCIDSPYAELNVTYTRQCIQVPYKALGCSETYDTWIVTKCSPKWNGSSHVKDLCEGDPLVVGNSLMLIPADSPSSGHTYRNYFCAVCNDDHRNADLWEVAFIKKEQPEFLGFCEGEATQDLVYKDDIAEWGYWNHFAAGEALFVPVTVNIYKYSTVLGSDQKCCPKGIVWGCAENWPINDSVRVKCEAYMAVIEHQKRLFRNIHCAICNHVEWTDKFICRAHYYIREPRPPGASGGSGGGVGISKLLAYDMPTKQCKDEGHQLVKGINGCRPVITLKKKDGYF